MNKPIPLLFLPQYINRVVDDKPGVYVLGDDENGFEPKYVGRSDTSLKNRLITHNHLYNHSYFIFKYVDDEKEAFFTEAKWWHDCKDNGMDLDNKIHPDAPNGSLLECPYCAFARDAQEVLSKKVG